MNDHIAMLFHDATAKAVDIVREALPQLNQDITIVRDFMGRLNILVDGRQDDLSEDQQIVLKAIIHKFEWLLARYVPPHGSRVFHSEDMFPDSADKELADRMLIDSRDGKNIWLLDRQITGQDWMRGSFERRTVTPRFTFFGIKGGVGRSTASAIWAWRLAAEGKRVLLFDLDLESPGVSSTLLPEDALPDFGIVDWFVEDGVGQGEIVLERMAGTSPIAREFEGEVFVVPAFGSETGEYLPKLARCYADLQGKENESWAARLHRMVEDLEIRHRPDVVLFDSRAGIHDIAAAVVTRFDAESLLFAVDSAQTWNAYALLFESWKRHPKLPEFRQRIQLIASMVPETNRDVYRDRMLRRAWDTFRDGIYDEEASGMADGFSFDLHAENAPHYPWWIYWNRALQEFDPLSQTDWMEEEVWPLAFGSLLEHLDERLQAISPQEE